jgi:hypothetical protein
MAGGPARAAPGRGEYVVNEVRGRARDAADRLWRAVESSTKGSRFEEQQKHVADLLAGVQNAELRQKISLAFEQQQKMLAEMAQTAGALLTTQQHNLTEARAAFEETLRARSLEVDEVETMDDLSDDTELDDEPPRLSPFAHVPDATRIAATKAAQAPKQEPSSVMHNEHVAQAAKKMAEKAKQRKVKSSGGRKQNSD